MLKADASKCCSSTVMMECLAQSTARPRLWYVEVTPKRNGNPLSCGNATSLADQATSLARSLALSLWQLINPFHGVCSRSYDVMQMRDSRSVGGSFRRHKRPPNQEEAAMTDGHHKSAQKVVDSSASSVNPLPDSKTPLSRHRHVWPGFQFLTRWGSVGQSAVWIADRTHMSCTVPCQCWVAAFDAANV